MKKLLGLLSIVTLFACTETNLFKITGNITGVENDQLVIGVFSQTTMTFTALDTVPVTKGQFEYSLPTIETTAYSFKLIGAEVFFGCILENGELAIKVDIADAQHDYINKVDLTGSANNDLVQQFDGMYQTIMERPEFAECKVVYSKMMAAYKSEDYEVYEELEKEYEKLDVDLKKEVWKAQKTLIEQDIDKYFAIHVFPFIDKNVPIKELQMLYKALPETSKKHPKMIEVKKDIDIKLAIQPGKPAPDFTLKTDKGGEFSLSSLKGKYVLIDFWASWCKPCRASFPHLKELYKKYHDKGFEIVGITNDTKADMWLKAIEEDQTEWIHVVDEFPIQRKPARVISQYGMDFLPSTVLIDSNGIIIAKLLHGDELDKKLEEIFGF